MSRTYTIEKTVYTFDELSESAKETAREELNRFLWECGSMQESMDMIFDGYMNELGWDDAHALTYSLYSQGGEPSWAGRFTFDHDGTDYPVSVTNRHYGGGSYGFGIEVDVEGTELDTDDAYGSAEWDATVARIQAVEYAVMQHLGSLSAELLRRFYAEDEYQSSEEQVAETAEANGYEYDEGGHLA